MRKVRINRHAKASARFFIRIGQTGRASRTRGEYTLPLFPLVLIMDAEGLLSDEARQLAQEVRA